MVQAAGQQSLLKVGAALGVRVSRKPVSRVSRLPITSGDPPRPRRSPSASRCSSRRGSWLCSSWRGPPIIIQAMVEVSFIGRVLLLVIDLHQYTGQYRYLSISTKNDILGE